jgi:general secretion pathway protein K
LPLQRKVGAAPHRGNANKPEAKQGKAKAKGKQTPTLRSKKESKPRR